MIGPTLPSRAERKLNTAPTIANARSGSRIVLAAPARRQTTTPIGKPPRRRERNDNGAEAKRKPPRSAAGTPVRANQPTTGRSSSLRLNQALLKFPNNCATVRIGIASRTPKAATSSGNRMAAPANPATAANKEPTKAAPASRIRFATDMNDPYHERPAGIVSTATERFIFSGK